MDSHCYNEEAAVRTFYYHYNERPHILMKWHIHMESASGRLFFSYFIVFFHYVVRQTHILTHVLLRNMMQGSLHVTW